MKAKPSSIRSGLTVIEVLVMVLVVFTLLALLLPALASTRRKNRRIACVNNIKQIELALKTWAVDCGDGYPMQYSVTNGGSMEYIGSGHTYPHFQAMSNELTTTTLLICPADSTRKVAENFQNDLTDSKISYFLSVDASDAHPASFFVGDSHLAIDGIPVKSGLLFLTTKDAVSWTSARHNGEGNTGLADGSVQQTTSSLLKKLLIESGHATNRLSIP